MIITLGRTSKRRLATCHPILKKIIKTAAADPGNTCDFGVACGSRGEAEQNEAFDNGKSNCKWGESDHNVMMGPNPISMGADVVPYDPETRDYVWDDEDPRYEALASHLMSTATKLGFKLEWGGNYVSIKDKPHYSLIF